MTSVLAVIPARYESQRLPGKPLASIGGRPMVRWVYEACASCKSFSNVIVATDDSRVVKTVESFGGNVEMTSSTHSSGTDRVAEVATRRPQVDVIVNVQGDLPFVSAKVLEQLVTPCILEPQSQMATVACPIKSADFYGDPNSVKVVCDRNMDAIYFSRASIPYFRNEISAPVYHHLGLYAFSREFLAAYSAMDPTPLEECESLEQLRVLENGHRIRVSLVDQPLLEVNSPQDLSAANLEANRLF